MIYLISCYKVRQRSHVKLVTLRETSFLKYSQDQKGNKHSNTH